MKTLEEKDPIEEILQGMDQETFFSLYNRIKEKIGELGFNTFIHSKEVEEYRKWLREDKYKHRLEWFEKEYPNGLYYKDEDLGFVGITLMTKKFLAEADAAYVALTEKEAEKEIEAESLRKWPMDKFGWIGENLRKDFRKAAMFGFKLKLKDNG